MTPQRSSGGAQRLQLLALEAELGPQVLGGGRADPGQVVEQPPPAGVVGPHPVGLGPRDRVEERGRLGADQQVLAPVDRHAEMTALG